MQGVDHRTSCTLYHLSYLFLLFVRDIIREITASYNYTNNLTYFKNEYFHVLLECKKFEQEF